MDIDKLRREYLQGGLQREDLAADPIDQFTVWLQQAVDAQIIDPTAMSVATVDAQGQPSQRIVLLKKVDSSGFVFYTNYGSRKAHEIDINPQVSLHFAWLAIERQVIVRGRAEKVSQIESLQYFSSRPEQSQLAAWASRQSQRISSRQLLEAQFQRMKEKFSHGKVPLPDFWGGFRVKPHTVEFWQGGANRLHDRFFYSRNDSSDDSQWSLERLAP